MINARMTGALIARLRRARDWSQLELAERLNVPHQAVWRWECGEAFPAVGLLGQIAMLLDVRVDDLFRGTVEEEDARTKRG